MKFSTLLAGLGLSLGLVTVANAKIVTGTMDASFATVYATDLTGQNHLTQYDAACKSKHWFLVNTPFYVDYRVNTDASNHSAFFNYANAEHTMFGSLNANGASYTFKTEQLSQSLKDMHAKALYFDLTSDFKYGAAWVVFEGVTVTPVNPRTHDKKGGDCPCDCDKKPVATYQCVLST